MDTNLEKWDENKFTEEELNVDVEQELQKLKNKNIFWQLTMMFERVRREYILMLCLKYENTMDVVQLTDVLVDILLQHGHEYEGIFCEKVSKLSLQECYEDLLEIFSDADPEYLMTQASVCLNDPNLFKEFVQTNLENKNYPTKAEYLKKKKICELEKYISNFDIQKFLEVFPNPFEYFEDKKRKSEVDLSLDYLKNNYKDMRLEDIETELQKNNYNLSLTVKNLNDKVNKKITFTYQPLKTENASFVQELAFIINRMEIVDYLYQIKANEARQYKQMMTEGGLLECQCCFSLSLITKCSECEKGHIFCFSCIVRGTEACIGDGKTHVQCFANCDSEFSLSTLQKVLKPTVFNIFLAKRQEDEVLAAGLDGLVSCPFCHFASIPPAEDMVFKCLNEDCMKESCKACKKLNHVPSPCEGSIVKIQHLLEEKMTHALLRVCYNCKKPFLKEGGCNKMTCTCGASMCYICNAPVRGYNHFRGEESNALNLCPLYTDDALLDAMVVRKAAENSANELMVKNPHAKRVAEKLMPTLPVPKQTGYHNNITNPLYLPEHALRARGYNNTP